MPTSDEDLAKEQAAVEKLREQVASEEATLLQRQQELANDVTANALQREKAALQARLDQLKGQSKVAAVREGAAAVVDPVKHAASIEDAKSAALVESGAVPAEAMPATTEKKGK